MIELEDLLLRPFIKNCQTIPFPDQSKLRGYGVATAIEQQLNQVLKMREELDPLLVEALA
ncbi:hypothetical protein [Fibrella forsythiae]|uniref:Uncharacterized protein n=1 Tax=Fibrella forsythiae TaxID=2817061 RepID=A0ABS3JUX1_9BACT|nr:hypothetical protein [Fibrella forsythiae]MBO0953176.1 hypothetical protein [Fibrella forsythiae]